MDISETSDGQGIDAIPSVPPPPPEPSYYPIRFTADGSEYFKIWIVNLALTILTLGIYSAWAKVRTKKYLYGNTEVAGGRFDYHADPKKILMGRLLIGALFFGYSLGGKLSPTVAVIFLLLFWSVFPWLIVRALIFALTNTSYRNIRFGFIKDYKASYAAYIKGALVWIFSLGIASPYAVKLHTCFKLNHMKFGNQRFKFDAPTGYFFKILYAFSGLMALGFIVGAMWIGITSAFGKNLVLSGIGVLLIYSGVFVGTAYLRARFSNLIANQTRLESISFRSNLKATDLAGIYLTNLICCVFTLGLYIPWAVVRTMKYRLEHTQVVMLPGALESLEADSITGSQNAAADAAVDFWDVDLGL